VKISIRTQKKPNKKIPETSLGAAKSPTKRNQKSSHEGVSRAKSPSRIK